MFFIIGIITAAFMEYTLHRYYLHQASHSHITHHHKIFKDKYEDSSYHLKDIASHPSYVFSSSLLSLAVTLIFMTFNQEGAYFIYIWALLYLIWLEVVHYLFHSPKGLKIENLTLFKQLKHHHHLHHIHYKVNYGIGSTFYDYILRTKLK